MEVKLADDLKIELEIPLLWIEEFSIWWKPNDHAHLQIVGMVDRKVICKWERVYESKVKLWRERGKEDEILFYGYLKNVDRDTVANTDKICLNVESSSCKLDIGKGSQSFQDTGKTYSEIEKQIVEENGGLVICTGGRDTRIKQPVIRYEETVWEFSKRIASHVNTCVVSDIESGKPAFWFGLPKGRQISGFPEEEYSIRVENHAKVGTSLVYEVGGQEFYKIGDQSTFLNQEVVITEAYGKFEYGELTFTYLLKRPVANSPILYQNKFSGLGLTGKILDIRKESVRVALDIDGGKSTGIYYYDWYPEIGNALYAMPEKGAKIVLYFGKIDEREAFVAHCLPNKEEELKYTERCLALENGGIITLLKESLGFSRKNNHKLSISDATVSLSTSKQISILAEGKIRLKANSISIKADAEVKIYQG